MLWMISGLWLRTACLLADFGVEMKLQLAVDQTKVCFPPQIVCGQFQLLPVACCSRIIFDCFQQTNCSLPSVRTCVNARLPRRTPRTFSLQSDEMGTSMSSMDTSGGLRVCIFPVQSWKSSSIAPRLVVSRVHSLHPPTDPLFTSSSANIDISVTCDMFFGKPVRVSSFLIPGVCRNKAPTARAVIQCSCELFNLIYMKSKFGQHTSLQTHLNLRPNGEWQWQLGLSTLVSTTGGGAAIIAGVHGAGRVRLFVILTFCSDSCLIKVPKVCFAIIKFLTK